MTPVYRPLELITLVRGDYCSDARAIDRTTVSLRFFHDFAHTLKEAERFDSSFVFWLRILVTARFYSVLQLLQNSLNARLH